MGCGASSEPIEVVEKVVVEEKTQKHVKRRWVCHKCTLKNLESVAVCGACGAVPSEGTAWLDEGGEDGKPGDCSEYLNYWQHCLDSDGESFVEGVWVDCRWVQDQSEVKLHKLVDCCICLEPLCFKSLGAFVNETGTRACPHYLHHRCAQNLPTPTCPICRTEYSHLVQVPRPDRHFLEWFNVTDITKSGYLTHREVVNSITAMTPFSEEEVASKLNERWPHYSYPIQLESVVPIVSYFFHWAGKQRCAPIFTSA
eukprot:TRINITY_DN42580_c0_g1_i1.p1 TRINITY_DN42580_c0_g1~~TRINITY_DN42580_c0_g1_i1.p1  ORF type:complete len:267 (+),score=21.60 TRINITY_DN42580_c0_g1_i1:37-801(+)